MTVVQTSLVYIVKSEFILNRVDINNYLKIISLYINI